MKKFISILSIFSMLIFSSVTCCGFAQETKETKKESNFALVVTCLTAAAITIGAGVKAYVDYWNAFKDGYQKGEDSVSFKNEVWNPACNGLETAWNGTKYGLGTAWNGTTYGLGKAWNGTTYGLGKAWNGTTYGLEKAWNGTKYGAGTAKDWIVDKWCNYIGWGCGDSTEFDSNLINNSAFNITNNSIFNATNSSDDAGL